MNGNLEQIRNIIKLTTDVYLSEHLPKIPEDKKQIAINAYEKDIERLANYIYNSGFFNDNFILSEDFIKGFHKYFYPEGYIQRTKDNKIWMIPGEYKKIIINSKDRIECKNTSGIDDWNPNKEIYTNPQNVVYEMKKMLNYFNDNFKTSIDIKQKKDTILNLMLSILYIHPFADGNGKVYNILGDLFFHKIGLKPVGFMNLRYKYDRLELYKVMYNSYFKKDLSYMYDFIEEIN